MDEKIVKLAKQSAFMSLFVFIGLELVELYDKVFKIPYFESKSISLALKATVIVLSFAAIFMMIDAFKKIASVSGSQTLGKNFAKGIYILFFMLILAFFLLPFLNNVFVLTGASIVFVGLMIYSLYLIFKAYVELAKFTQIVLFKYFAYLYILSCFVQIGLRILKYDFIAIVFYLALLAFELIAWMKVKSSLIQKTEK